MARSRSSRSLAALFALVLAGLLPASGASPLAAQLPLPEPADPAAEEAGDAPPGLGVAEIVPRAAETLQAAGVAEERIARLVELEALTAEVEAAAGPVARLERRLEETLAEPRPRPERVRRLRAQAEAQAAGLERLEERVGERVERLTGIARDWRERAALWDGVSEELADDPALAPLVDEVARARESVAGVQRAVGEALPRVLALGRRLREVEGRRREISQRARDVLGDRAASIWRRDAPPLAAEAVWGELGRAAAALPEAAREGWRELAADPLPARPWVLLLQLALAAAVVWLARRFGRLGQPGQRWSRMLAHPWALGLFVAAATLSILYEPTPPLWELGVRVVLAATVAVLATALFANPRKRFATYALAVFYPLWSLVEAISLPAPLVRLALAVLAAAGALAAFVGARGDRKLRGPGTFPKVLFATAAALAVVAAAELAGFDALARRLVEAGVASAFVAFVLILLLRLVRGGVHALLSREIGGRLHFLRRVGYRLAGRVTRLVEAALVVAGVLYLVSIWGLGPSPTESWRFLVSRGVSIGDYQLTAGRVLLAVLAVYLAFLVSWLVRAFLDVELVDRRELDPGLSDSIKTLFHYAVVVVGFLVAVAGLGVELQNLVILLSALGVGIGFGLQNVVNNFVSGLVLLFERPVRTGDVVVVGGTWGTIQKIGLRSTLVRTFDRSELIVPNSDLISEKVVNWTLSDKTSRVVVPVGVAYGSDVAEVFRQLEAAATEHPLVVDDPAPMILFVRFGESSLDFELRVWVREMEHRLEVASELHAEVERRFRDAGITIPFPQRDLHVKSFPASGPGDVRGPIESTETEGPGGERTPTSSP